MIHIVGSGLCQWDTGRTVSVTDSGANKVHFANPGDSHAPILDLVDGVAKIPDYLLMTGKPLCVYAVQDGVTLERRAFPVKKRERPEDYVYEDDQRNYIYTLVDEAIAAIANANQAAEDLRNAKANGEFDGKDGTVVTVQTSTYKSTLPTGEIITGVNVTFRTKDPNTGKETSKTITITNGKDGHPGIIKTLLWENASPKSVFAGQTLGISALDQHDEIEVEFSAYGAYAGDNGDHRIKIVIPTGASPITGDLIQGIGSLVTTDMEIHRSFKAAENYVTFLPGFRDGKANSNYMIPYKIYGIKGVQ